MRVRAQERHEDEEERKEREWNAADSHDLAAPERPLEVPAREVDPIEPASGSRELRQHGTPCALAPPPTSAPPPRAAARLLTTGTARKGCDSLSAVTVKALAEAAHRLEVAHEAERVLQARLGDGEGERVLERGRGGRGGAGGVRGHGCCAAGRGAGRGRRRGERGGRARVPPSRRPPGRALRTRKPVAPLQRAQRGGWRVLQNMLHGTLEQSHNRVSRGMGRTKGEPLSS